jgi:hypothetical protein
MRGDERIALPFTIRSAVILRIHICTGSGDHALRSTTESDALAQGFHTMKI